MIVYHNFSQHREKCVPFFGFLCILTVSNKDPSAIRAIKLHLMRVFNHNNIIISNVGLKKKVKQNI